MDVRCPQCATLFELDERQVRAGGATLKCSVCEHVFRLSPSRALDQENQPRWMVRARATGDVLYFSGFDTLHRWILERRVLPEDELSRTGQRWIVVQEVGEFAPIFQVLESIHSVTQGRAAELPDALAPLPGARAPAPQARAPLSGPQDALAARARQGTMQQFPGTTLAPLPPRQPTPSPVRQPTPAPQPEPRSEPRPERRSEPPRQGLPPSPHRSEHKTPVRPRPAARAPMASAPIAQDTLPTQPEERWELGDASEVLASVSGAYQGVNAAPRRRWPALIALMLVLALVGAGGYLWRFERERVDAWLGASRSDAAGEGIVVDAPVAHAPPEASPIELASRALASALRAAEQQRVSADQAQRSSLRALATAEGSARVDSAREGAQREGAQRESAQREGAQREGAQRESARPDPKALTRAGKRALEQRQLARARALFHEAIELDGRNAEAIAGLGWTLLSLGELDTSATQFRRALAADSRHGDAYIGLGKVERARGKLWEALAAYEDYLSRFPQGPQVSIASHQRAQLKQALGL